MPVGVSEDEDIRGRGELVGRADAKGLDAAVAATKTYLNQVAALALLAVHAAGEEARFASAIGAVADQLEEVMPSL